MPKAKKIRYGPLKKIREKKKEYRAYAIENFSEEQRQVELRTIQISRTRFGKAEEFSIIRAIKKRHKRGCKDKNKRTVPVTEEENDNNNHDEESVENRFTENDPDEQENENEEGNENYEARQTEDNIDSKDSDDAQVMEPIITDFKAYLSDEEEGNDNFETKNPTSSESLREEECPFSGCQAT